MKPRPWWVGPGQGPQHTQVWEHQGKVLMRQQLGRRGHTSVPLLMPEGLSSGTTGSAAPPPSLPRPPITECACASFKALHLHKLLLEPQFQGSTGRLGIHPCNCFGPALRLPPSPTTPHSLSASGSETLVPEEDPGWLGLRVYVT